VSKTSDDFPDPEQLLRKIAVQTTEILCQCRVGVGEDRIQRGAAAERAAHHILRRARQIRIPINAQQTDQGGAASRVGAAARESVEAERTADWDYECLRCRGGNEQVIASG